MEFRVMISTAEINKQVFQIKKEIGLELRCRRERKGLSLAEAASVCGLSPNRIMRIENGYAFSFRHIFMLAAVYGVEAQLRLKLKRFTMVFFSNMNSSIPANSLRNLKEVLAVSSDQKILFLRTIFLKSSPVSLLMAAPFESRKRFAPG